MNNAPKTEATPKFESNPFKVIFNGFSNLFKYNQTLAIVILIVSLFGVFGQMFNPGYFGGGGGGTSTSSSTSTGEPTADIVGIILLVIFIIALISLPVIIFISTMYSGFVSYVAWKTSRQETTDFGEAIGAVWKKFWTVLWANTIVFFKILGGLILFIVPGIRAAMRYNMVLFPIFDEDANARQAIAKSKEVTRGHLLEIFGMNVAAAIIPLVSQTMLIGGQSIMYPQLKHLGDKKAAKPKVHWLNYLGFILLGLFLVVVSLITPLVLAFASK
jgi:hypothetical protein